MIIKSIYLMLLAKLGSCQNLTLVSQSRSGYLEKYESYVDTVLMHFTVPEDLLRVSFKFRASEMSYSIFGCKPKEVAMYLKYGSPPVINPDGTKFPERFLMDGRAELYSLNFTSNKQYSYVNMSAPVHGSYYAIAFHPYTDPKNDAITQQGKTSVARFTPTGPVMVINLQTDMEIWATDGTLRNRGLIPECHTYIDASVYAQEPDNVIFVMPDIDIRATIKSNQSDLFKLYTPENVNSIIFRIKSLKYCDNCTELSISVQALGSPISKNRTVPLNATTEAILKFWVTDETRYTVLFQMEKNGSDWDVLGKFLFELKYMEINPPQLVDSGKNLTYPNAVQKVDSGTAREHIVPYKQYDLHKSLSAESFMFTYEMQPLDGSIPIAVNITSDEFAVLKFHVSDVLDVGGSIRLLLAFKPRLYKKDRYFHKEKLPENYTLIGCVRNSEKEVPAWKDRCRYGDDYFPSALVLNRTNENDSVLVPYPESGDWYLSFKLFCSECVPCNCSENCEGLYKECVRACTTNCREVDCGDCHGMCEEKLVKTVGCKGCDCDDGCLKSKEVCNATIVFDVSSYPCVSDGCGSNGKCAFLVSEGFVFSSCVCNNNYKGWDCSDNSNASTISSLILEMLLLVMSNLPFLAAVVVAFRRKYYVEMLVYFSTWFFSSFYHACDSGENIISFCITRLNVLQYCDFYCALLSIWVTLIAIAHLSPPLPHMFHIAGTIIIGAGTTLDKTSIWVFLLPVSCGIVIIAGNWGLKYYSSKILFPSKQYLKFILPCGLFVVTIGLVLYGLFQTQSNYKYIHSLWHALMAVSVMILLPKMDTFLPNAQYL